MVSFQCLFLFYFPSSFGLIHFLVHAECFPNNIFLVDMGMNYYPWLKMPIKCCAKKFFFHFYLILCDSLYPSLQWLISVCAVFIWIEILLPCKFQACNYETSFGVNFLVHIVPTGNDSSCINMYRCVYVEVIRNISKLFYWKDEMRWQQIDNLKVMFRLNLNHGMDLHLWAVDLFILVGFQGWCPVSLQLHYTSTLCPCNSGTFSTGLNFDPSVNKAF